MTDNTPTPWKLSPPTPARFPAHHIQSETGAYIADVEIRAQNPAGANAAFIVLALAGAA